MRPRYGGIINISVLSLRVFALVALTYLKYRSTTRYIRYVKLATIVYQPLSSSLSNISSGNVLQPQTAIKGQFL